MPYALSTNFMPQIFNLLPEQHTFLWLKPGEDCLQIFVSHLEIGSECYNIIKIYKTSTPTDVCKDLLHESIERGRSVTNNGITFHSNKPR